MNNYDITIPPKVRYDNNLKPMEKLIYGELVFLSKYKGYSDETNDYFSTLYNVSKETVSRYISNLKRNKYITVSFVYKKNSQEIERRIIKIIGETP